MTDTLFAFADRVHQRTADILDGREVARPASEEERAVLTILRAHVGKARSISRAELAERTGLADREVRAVVSELREQFSLPICSNREQGGYYLAETLAEVCELTGPMIRQALSLLRSVRSLTDRRAAAELLGQARIALAVEREEGQQQ